MTTTYKILGQLCPNNGYQSGGTPGVWYTMYTVPASTQAIIRSIIISCNVAGGTGPISVALLPSGVSTSTSISTSSSIISMSLPGGVNAEGKPNGGGAKIYKYHVTMGAGDKIVVRHESTAAAYTSTITLSGVEIT